MSIVSHLCNDEKERLEEYISFAKNKLQDYLRGSLQVKKRYNQAYLYLVYRDAARVVFKYLGRDEPLLRADIEDQLAKRKELESKLKQAESLLIEVNQAIRNLNPRSRNRKRRNRSGN